MLWTDIMEVSESVTLILWFKELDKVITDTMHLNLDLIWTQSTQYWFRLAIKVLFMWMAYTQHSQQTESSYAENTTYAIYGENTEQHTENKT